MAKPKVFNRSSAGTVNFAGAIDRTQQQFQAECDINQVVRRLSAGQPVPAPKNVGRYGDFASVPDFWAANNLLIRAREQFMSLPARVRERFKQDPAEMLAFVADRKNFDEARKLGLLSDEAVSRADAAAAAAAAKVEVKS